MILTIFRLITKTNIKAIAKTFKIIPYPISLIFDSWFIFKKIKKVKELIEFRTKIDIITLIYIEKLSFAIQIINIKP